MNGRGWIRLTISRMSLMRPFQLPWRSLLPCCESLTRRISNFSWSILESSFSRSMQKPSNSAFEESEPPCRLITNGGLCKDPTNPTTKTQRLSRTFYHEVPHHYAFFFFFFPLLLLLPLSPYIYIYIVYGKGPRDCPFLGRPFMPLLWLCYKTLPFRMAFISARDIGSIG